eukprot:4929122-Pyramimonas_sp.AAC.2
MMLATASMVELFRVDHLAMNRAGFLLLDFTSAPRILRAASARTPASPPERRGVLCADPAPQLGPTAGCANQKSKKPLLWTSH